MRSVVYAGTRNVYPNMVTACKSLVEHKGADQVLFLIEDDEFPEPLPKMIRCINVSKQQYFHPMNASCRKRWTYMALMKAALPLMPEMPRRLLWLDIDTIVMGDLGELWSLPAAPIYLVREARPDEEYYNTGVMLMDNVLMKEYAHQIIDRINNRTLDFPDQDAINYVMAGKIKPLDPKFNATEWTERPEGDPVIRHFAAEQYYHMRQIWKHYQALKWEDVLKD